MQSKRKDELSIDLQSFLLRWKANILLLLLLLYVSLLICAHEQSLSPEVDVWDGDKGRLARAPAVTEFRWKLEWTHD